MAGVMFVHHARMASMRASLDTATFGRPIKIASGFSFRGDEHFLNNDIRVKADGDPLGCIGDLGWYNIRFALWAFGFDLPAKARATCLKKSAAGIPIDVNVELTWADGRLCHFDNSFVTAFRQWAEIAGENAVLRLDDFVISRSHESAMFTCVPTFCFLFFVFFLIPYFCVFEILLG
jgi:predicted dehydrogenase